MCIDHWKLNNVTMKNKYRILIIDDLFDELQGCSFFAKIFLRLGYYKLRLKESEILKKSFQTHFGHYEFYVMSLGLISAPETLMDVMNSIFKQYLDIFVIVFIDGI